MTFLDYVSSHKFALIQETYQHAELVALAVALATAVGVALGVATWRRPRASALVIAVTGGFLTIPSFALLSLLIPLLGFGLLPTTVGLVVYGLLPIVRNTVVGLRSVDPALIEAGRGMGLSPGRLLMKVQLPLAWPVVLTGIRVSTQLLLGIAAIAAYVKGPGLGTEIFSALARFGSVNAVNQALAGTLGVVVLALAFDAFYIVVRRYTTSRGIRA